VVDESERSERVRMAQQSEAKRHLLALRDPVAIVGIALADHARFKDATLALSRCDPCPRAARALIDAHDAGEAPSWLVACLLGYVRHPSGYPRVMEILRRGDRFLSESHAAEAALRIAGADAQPELEDVIDTVEDGMARKAAALVLARMGTSAIGFLAAAPARGRLPALTVGYALAPVAVEPETLAGALRSADRETRRWPAMMMAVRLRAPQSHAPELGRCARSPSLRAALAVVIAEGEETAWPRVGREGGAPRRRRGRSIRRTPSRAD
jgi:hypothetical protein